MEKELDNQVEFIICKPNNLKEHPTWVSSMDCYDGENITDLDICSEILNKLLIRSYNDTIVFKRYFFSLDWIVIKINGKEIDKNEYTSTI